MTAIKVVQAQDLAFSYGLDSFCLRNINFSVQSGEFVVFRGASGSGKTSLLNLIGALERPSSGCLQVCGLSLESAHDSALASLRNEKIGFVFQSFHLDDKRTVLENVMLPLYFGSGSISEGVNLALELLRRMGMQEYKGRLVSQLSGGQRQRVAIARSLINHPTLLLADEPLGHLDDTNAQAILALLQELHQEHHLTVIMTAHEQRGLEHFSRTIHLEKGALVE